MDLDPKSLIRKAGFWRGLIVAINAFVSLTLMGQPGFTGLGYMSSLGLGFLLLGTAPLYGLTFSSKGSVKELSLYVGKGTLWLVLPLALWGLWQATWFPLCAPGRALLFLFLGPCFGAAFGILLGASIRKSLGSRSAWWGILVYFVLLAASVLWHVWRIYTEPSVFFYHPIVGYFAGPIYDTTAEVTAAYWLHRMWWLAALPLFLAPWLMDKRRWRLIGLTSLLLGFSLRSTFGIDPGRTAIMGQLSQSHEGQFVVVHADPDGYTAQDLKQLVRVMDFHVADVSDWLGRDLPSETIHALVFKNAEQKRRLMGAGRTEVAKPWLNEIYVAGIRPGDSVIRHELAHVLAGDLASGPMEVPAKFVLFPNMVLVEGLATAATWESGALTPHGWSAMMEDLEIRPPIEGLLGPVGFWKAHGPLAYTLSASFIEWYRSEFGKEALRQAYAEDELGGPDGAGLGTLEARWVSECLGPESKNLGPGARELAKERFSRRPTYQRPCGFLLRKRIQDLLAVAAKGDLEEAFSEIEALLEITGGDPEIAALKIRAARLAVSPEEMIDAARDLLARTEVQTRPELFATIRRALSDACWWLRATECSRAALAEIEPRMLSRPLARSIWVRRLLLAQPSEEHGFLLDYLSGYPDMVHSFEEIRAIAMRHPESPLVQYLLGFQYANHGQWPEAIKALARVGTPELWPSVLIREASFRAGRFSAFLDAHDEADFFLNQALGFESLTGHQVPILRWKRYVDYFRGH